jgi:selenium metabolism protein YedF
MSNKIIDARGLPCPQPVILTRNAMREADEVTTLVTGADQVANVRRLAEKAGWQVDVSEGAEGFSIALRRTGQAAAVAPEPEPETAGPGGPSVVAVPSDQMGRGEPELGGVLVRAFFHTLTEMEELPRAIVFYNTGVKLAALGSPIADDLCALASRGVEVLVCGTCLGYYDLRDKVAAGVVSNMYTIAETLLRAGNVVSL